MSHPQEKMLWKQRSYVSSKLVSHCAPRSPWPTCTSAWVCTATTVAFLDLYAMCCRRCASDSWDDEARNTEESRKMSSESQKRRSCVEWGGGEGEETLGKGLLIDNSRGGGRGTCSQVVGDQADVVDDMTSQSRERRRFP